MKITKENLLLYAVTDRHWLGDKRHLAYGHALFPRPATDRERARAEKIPARYARHLDTRRLEL